MRQNQHNEFMKLAIISGGSKGLGAALCEQYQALSFEVIEFSRSAPHAFSVTADMASVESASQIFRESFASYAHRDWQEIVAISNAGTLTPIGSAAKKPSELVVANLNINLVSGVSFISEVVRSFQSNDCKKTMVNISSGAASGARAGWSLYCASKAGMEHFIRALALEQDSEQYPFKAINIIPGLIDTDMQSQIRQSDVEDFPSLELFKQRQSDGLLVSPAKVARSILKIVDDSRIQNGQETSVVIDG